MVTKEGVYYICAEQFNQIRICYLHSKNPIITLKAQGFIHIAISRTLQLVESCENFSLATIFMIVPFLTFRK